MMKTLKSQIQVRSGLVRILVGMVLVMLILDRAALAEDLLLSEAKDISDLGLAGVYVQPCPGLDGIRATDRQELLSLHGIRTRTLTYSIDITDCALFKTADGYGHLVTNRLPNQTNPGQPQLPMKTLTAKLARNAEILGIEVVSGSYRQILNSVNLAPSPQPYIWMRQEDIPEQVRKRMELASLYLETYDVDTYFPGEIATYSSGKDNNSTYVYIRAFPVQYIFSTNKAILVTSAKINVYYSLPTSPVKTFTSPVSVDAAECVIICPSELKPAAELLRDFHVGKENVSTSVLTTEYIDATYPPAADPIYKGYTNDYTGGKDKIVGYDYELAKKIISYLRDQQAHPNLKYVTLLGDGKLVPPSYYLNEWAAYEWYDLESYYDWIPTDFLYTSPDYDLVPNYRVGRLPVSDVRQAESAVDKIERWHSSLSWEWFKRASVGGGRPFGTMWYYGELSTADLINKDIFNGMEISKYYYTNGTFDVDHIKPLLATEDTGLFYHVDHGNGHKLWVGDNAIDACDVLIPSTYRFRPFNPEAPIVVSVSCINGAYDTDLTNFEDQPEFPELPYRTSFGESIVLSDAGGIAYIGGARLNYADWGGVFDQGRFFASHYAMHQICGSVLESYHKGTARLGDMTYDALRYYAQDNYMESSVNRETVFGFVLLGDPVLSIPTQQPGLSCQRPYLAALQPDRYSGEGIPRYEDLPEDQSKPISIACHSDSPTIDAKSIYTWNDVVIDIQSPNAAPLTYTFTPEGCGYHLVRSSAEDGKEGWLYLNAQFVFNPTSEILLIDGDYGAEYQKYYTDALDNLGQTYDIWENGARDPIDVEILAQYLDGILIWSIPFEPPPSEGEKGATQFYLDSGGRLFITGQDIGFYLTQSGTETDNFYERYLHAQYVQDSAPTDTLSGIPGDPIGDGLSINISGGDGANNQYWPDEIEPNSPDAQPVFIYEPNREGALRVDTGTYKVVYFGFGFEGIDSQADRNQVMERVLDWLVPPHPEGAVKNLTTGQEYLYIQPAVIDASPGDEIVVSEGIYRENVDLKGKNLTIRSANPNDSAVVAATVINGRSQDAAVRFSGGEDANCVLAGFTITGADKGIYCLGASPTITKCTIVGNAGAGIKLWNQSNLTITNCTISGNGGDGIEMLEERSGRFIKYNYATIRNCVIAGNWQHGISGSVPTVINSTIVGNRQRGIFSPGATVTNSIIRFNGHGYDFVQIDVVSASVTYSNVQGGWSGTGDIDADPCFVGPVCWVSANDANVPAEPGDANAVWLGSDYRLLPDSLCVDGGDPNYVPQLGETDLDGNSRLIGKAIDMGAFESQTMIDLSEDEFEFEAVIGFVGPPEQLLIVRNSGVGTLNWQITYDCGWLKLGQNTGSSIGQGNAVVLSVDATGLAAGSYDCAMTISAPLAVNSPQVIPVRLVVHKNCFPDTPEYAQQYAEFLRYLAVGSDPSCWCAPPHGSGYQCDGDADGDTQTVQKYRVFTNDLLCVIENWKKKVADPTIDPCCDFDHKAETYMKYRVFGNDLATVVAGWKKKSSELPGDCPRPDGQ